jgi:dTDP-glucose pyrophosphorylase
VLGSDNLYTFRVTDVIDAMEAREASAVAVLEAEAHQELRSANCVEIGPDGRITRMEEKPAEPFSRLFVPPVYGYAAEALALVDEYLSLGGNPDAPGHFCAWLTGRVPVWAWLPPHGSRLDVGTPEGLAQARTAASDSDPGA